MFPILCAFCGIFYRQIGAYIYKMIIKRIYNDSWLISDTAVVTAVIVEVVWSRRWSLLIYGLLDIQPSFSNIIFIGFN